MLIPGRSVNPRYAAGLEIGAHFPMARSAYRSRASSATLSRKLSSANGFYDDVFTGPARVGVPTFSSRVEDYCEIFGTSQASRGSSIPVLDLPIANEREACSEARSSAFDYSAVFGGLDDVDFAASYEDLITEPKEGDITYSEEAWYGPSVSWL